MYVGHVSVVRAVYHIHFVGNRNLVNDVGLCSVMESLYLGSGDRMQTYNSDGLVTL